MGCKSCRSEAHFSQPHISHRKFSSPAARPSKIFLACGAPSIRLYSPRLRRAHTSKFLSPAAHTLKIFVACGALIKIFRRLRRAHSSPAARSNIRIFVACGALIEKFLPSLFSAPPALPIESFLKLAGGALFENFRRLRRAHRKMLSPAACSSKIFFKIFSPAARSSSKLFLACGDPARLTELAV